MATHLPSISNVLSSSSWEAGEYANLVALSEAHYLAHSEKTAVVSMFNSIVGMVNEYITGALT